VLVTLQRVHERDERHLRRVALVVEHRLAGEQAPQRDAVEAAGQAAVLARPRLEAVGDPEAVESDVRVADLVADPSAGPIGITARVDDVLEGAVDRDLVASARPPQRSRHAEAVERQHAARVGRPPRQDLLRAGAHRHGEQALGVRGEDRVRLEVGADADDAVLVGAVSRWELPGDASFYFFE
jgi:hypothetical protein